MGVECIRESHSQLFLFSHREDTCARYTIFGRCSYGGVITPDNGAEFQSLKCKFCHIEQIEDKETSMFRPKLVACCFQRCKANNLESCKVSNFVWMLQQSSRILLQDKVETLHQPHILEHTLIIFGQQLPTVVTGVKCYKGPRGQNQNCIRPFLPVRLPLWSLPV